MNTVCHITSVHRRYDTRIYIKMCKSLSAQGFSVSLVVADGQPNVYGQEGGVEIWNVAVKHSKSRLRRVIFTTRAVYKKAKELDCDIYHIHDPELIPIGLKLKQLGKLVIFDSHEDFSKQILGKPYLIKPLKKVISEIFKLYERYFVPRYSAIVAATPTIRDRYLPLNKNTIDVNNYPALGDIDYCGEWDAKKREVIYVGAISKIRGVAEIVHSLEYTQEIVLNLAGNFDDDQLKKQVMCLNGWSRVIDHGFIDREKLREILRRSTAGLVTLHPAINYIDALPVKMFEYMASGIPVIASDFPLWREIIHGFDCGKCVDPLNPESIGEAIMFFVSNPEEAKRMGRNGRKIVEEKYNWENEEKKLVSLYCKLLNISNHGD